MLSLIRFVLQQQQQQQQDYAETGKDGARERKWENASSTWTTLIDVQWNI